MADDITALCLFAALTASKQEIRHLILISGRPCVTRVVSVLAANDLSYPKTTQ